MVPVGICQEEEVHLEVAGRGQVWGDRSQVSGREIVDRLRRCPGGWPQDCRRYSPLAEHNHRNQDGEDQHHDGQEVYVIG
jgi:hypothetical protein